MFCINCHVFFDWTNLKIIQKTQYVHNPEYTAYLAKRGPLPIGDCGNEFVISNVIIHFLEKKLADNDIKIRWGDEIVRKSSGIRIVPEDNLLKIVENYKFFDLLSNCIRISNQILDGFNGQINYLTESYNNNLLNLRLRFLDNDFDKDEWKCKVQRVNKKYNKDNEIKEIERLFFLVSKDIILKSLNDEFKKDDPHYKENISKEKYYGVIKEIREYYRITYKCLSDISKKYKTENSSIHLSYYEKLLEWKCEGS